MRAAPGIFILLATIGLRGALADNGEPTRQDQYVILRNGHILYGLVTPIGERYTVALRADATRQVVVPASDVELVCESLDEAYFRKLSGLSARDASGRLALAEWCLRHGLVPRAADQILAVRNIEPRHPRLAFLERRLEQTAHPTPREEATKSAARRVSVSRDMVVTEHGAPDPRIERFAATVQPFLLQRCAGNSCHSATGSSTFRLIRPRQGEAVASRFTRRNATAAMTLIDLDDPDNSRLLSVPSSPHGSLRVPLLAAGDGHYERLLAWVRFIASQREELRSVAQDGVESIPTNVGGKFASDPTRPPSVAGGTAPPGTAPPTIPRLMPSTGVAAEVPATTNASAAPRDPFDPEIFNRELFNSPEK